MKPVTGLDGDYCSHVFTPPDGNSFFKKLFILFFIFVYSSDKKYMSL